MENAKVMEVLNKSVLTEYLHKLISAKMSKLVLFPVFPITAAANVSEPIYLALIENPNCLVAFTKGDLN